MLKELLGHIVTFGATGVTYIIRNHNNIRAINDWDELKQTIVEVIQLYRQDTSVQHIRKIIVDILEILLYINNIKNNVRSLISNYLIRNPPAI